MTVIRVSWFVWTEGRRLRCRPLGQNFTLIPHMTVVCDKPLRNRIMLSGSHSKNNVIQLLTSSKGSSRCTDNKLTLFTTLVVSNAKTCLDCKHIL